MNEPSSTTPATIAHDWKQAPLSVAWPGSLPGLSAALFGGEDARNLELVSRMDPSTHVVSVALSPCRLARELDGRTVWSGDVAVGDVTIVQAGRAPASLINGTWQVIQLYLPANDVRQVAEDLGVAASDARNLEVTCPRFRPDRVLTRIGRSLRRRLLRDNPPSRLELDELALVMAERIVQRFSDVRLPPRPRVPTLSRAELSLALDLLQGAEEPELADLACLLGRTPHDVEAAFARALRTAPWQVREALRRGRRS
jgi:hypothetical protein